MLEKISIFTDASFDKKSSVAILGAAYLPASREQLCKEDIKLTQSIEKNNIRAEIKSALLALESCPPDRVIILYTDCATICGLIGRREKLERTKYISKAKGVEIKNKDLYEKFYELYDKLNPEIVWVKGHKPKKQQSDIDKNFSFLDKIVRSKLRLVL